MGCPAEVEIGDNLVFSVNSHTFATGAAADADAVPAYRVYEDETGTAILTGNMAKLDDANTLGFYSEIIACTSGNGFENGKSYSIYISAAVSSVTGTISFGFKAYDQRKADALKISTSSTAADNLELQYNATGLTGDTFPATQAQLGQIALTGAAINTPAVDAPNGFVITSGENEANDEDSTHALDGATHDLEAVADGVEKIECYYEFTIGGDGVPTGVQAHHQITTGGGAPKDLTVWAYNWAGTSWDQIGTLSSSTLVTDSYTLFTAHVGTGANLGKVRVRYLTGSVALAAASTLKVDQIFVSYAVVARSVGYAGGAIWVDTNASNTNTEAFVDGVADNPVSTWAAALTLNTALGLNQFSIANGSTITLSGNSDNYTLFGKNWTLALGGQSIASAHFNGASVTGIGTGAGADFHDCVLAGGASLTVAAADFFMCAIAGDVVCSAAGTYYFDACFSGVAGTSTPSLDFGGAVASTNVNFRHYSGGIEVKNIGANGTDNMSLEGHGQIVLNTNCAGGTIAIRGHFTVTDNAAGAVALSDDARYDVLQVEDTVWDAILSGSSHNSANSSGKRLRQLAGLIISEGTAQGPGTGPNQIQLAAGESAVDGTFDPSLIYLSGGTGSGQSRLIFEYDGGTTTVTVDRDWKTAPDATTEYTIIANPGREHVNEGLAQGGTANTITLNSLASSVDNAYKGQSVFIRGGTGDDQLNTVLSYVGATKVATMVQAWSTTPDSTSCYAMLPSMGGLLDAANITQAYLAAFANTDTGEGSSASGSVTKLAQGTGVSGSGADQVTVNIASGGNPVADADVWITTDAAGTNTIAGTLQSDSNGDVLFLLDAGNTYYLWMEKGGVNPIAGESFVAVAD